MRRAAPLCPLGKCQRYRIDAIALPRRLRPIIKHMPQMRITHRAGHLHTPHAKGAILVIADMLLRNRLPIARPPRPRFKLMLGAKQRRIATYACIDPITRIIPIETAKRPLGTLAPRHPILLARQRLLPLRITLIYPFHTTHHITIPSVAQMLLRCLGASPARSNDAGRGRCNCRRQCQKAEHTARLRHGASHQYGVASPPYLVGMRLPIRQCQRISGAHHRVPCLAHSLRLLIIRHALRMRH